MKRKSNNNPRIIIEKRKDGNWSMEFKNAKTNEEALELIIAANACTTRYLNEARVRGEGEGEGEAFAWLNRRLKKNT
jgi:hypothetical protein